MRVSGRTCDRQFAAGLLSELHQHLALLDSAEQHYRPIVDLSLPLGKVEGDVAFRLKTASGEILVVVEREGSGPGNERNILKWFQAARLCKPIRLKSASGMMNCKPDAILLLFALCRPSKWDKSDFEKTAAFCTILAELINEEQAATDGIFRAVIYSYPSEAADWELCGRGIARAIVEEDLCGLKP